MYSLTIEECYRVIQQTARAIRMVDSNHKFRDQRLNTLQTVIRLLESQHRYAMTQDEVTSFKTLYVLAAPSSMGDNEAHYDVKNRLRLLEQVATVALADIEREREQQREEMAHERRLRQMMEQQERDDERAAAEEFHQRTEAEETDLIEILIKPLTPPADPGFFPGGEA